VEVVFDAARPPASEDSTPIYESSVLAVRRTPASYHWTYRDRTEFLIGARGDRVVSFTPNGAVIEDSCLYLVGPVFGFVLRLRGVVCLHASLVVIAGRAVAFCGTAGAGKSSIVAAFSQLGYPILAEDVAALDDRGDTLAVQPGYPRVNLWPDSVAALCGSADGLPKITPQWEKRYLPLVPATSFHSTPAPLAAVYILGDRIPEVQPAIRALQPNDAFIALVANSYTYYLLDASMRAREFEVLGRVVRTVPVRAVSPPSDIAHMPDLCDALLDDFANL